MEGEFISLCGKGKLDEAKALYRFFENVDVSYNNELAFRFAVLEDILKLLSGYSV